MRVMSVVVGTAAVPRVAQPRLGCGVRPSIAFTARRSSCGHSRLGCFTGSGFGAGVARSARARLFGQQRLARLQRRYFVGAGIAAPPVRDL